MKTYSIGIIGYGGFGKFLHHWWSRQEGIQVIAVADTKLQASEADSFKVYKDGRDLINNQEVDIVSIVTPPSFHADLACDAMRAGKHVLLEKPVALTNDEAQQIREVQRETGRVVLVNHMIRYNPIIKAIQTLSLDGKLGKLRHAVVTNYAQDSLLPLEHWFWNRKVSGGIFIEHGVHFIDIINALTIEKYQKVIGYWNDRNERQRDQVAAMIRYDGGLIANHYHSFSGPGFFERTSIRLMFDLAKVEIEGWMPMKGTVQALVGDTYTDEFNIMPGWRLDTLNRIDTMQDQSRPEGWGDVSTVASQLVIAGIPYNVDSMLMGTFEIAKTKGEVYGFCVQEVLKDLIAKVENPAHQTAITLEDACRALEIAVLASEI